MEKFTEHPELTPGLEVLPETDDYFNSLAGDAQVPFGD